MTLDEQIENIWELIDINNNAKTISIYLTMLRYKVNKKKAVVRATTPAKPLLG